MAVSSIMTAAKRIILSRAGTKPQPIVEQLKALGFSLQLSDDIQQQDFAAAEVILLTDWAEFAPLTEALKNTKSDQAPLIAMICHDGNAPTESSLSSLIDLFLPASPDLIEHHLQRHFQARTAQHKLEAENNRLEQEVKRLQQLTEKQKSTNQAVEVLKDAIVRNVSHELKTPLLHVKSAVALIAEDAKSSSLVNYAQNATSRLEEVIKNITLLGTSLELKLEPVIVRDAVAEANRAISRIAQRREKADRIQISIEDSLPPVVADKHGLSTILQLLIDNALKFSDDEVQVVSRKQEDYIYFSVRDRGIGIEPREIDQIFTSFYQIDNSSTRRYGGTGVGLTLVKLLLEQHRSKIQVESEQGHGTNFYFTLPAVSSNHPEKTGAATSG